jgi:hypothetical protein
VPPGKVFFWNPTATQNSAVKIIPIIPIFKTAVFSPGKQFEEIKRTIAQRAQSK